MIPFSLEKKDYNTRQGRQSWRRNRQAVVTALSACVEFIVTIMIAGVGRCDCMLRNSPLSITAYAERGVTCFERGEDGAV